MRIVVGLFWLSLTIALQAQETAVALAPNHPCAEAASTLDMSICYSAELKKANKALNQFYQSLLKELDKADRESLRRAQRSWVQYRDADCESEYRLWGGGSGGPNGRLICTFNRTEERLDLLRRRYDLLLN